MHTLSQVLRTIGKYFRIQNGTQLVAFFILLSIILTPLHIPLSIEETAPTYTPPPVTAYEYYEKEKKEETQRASTPVRTTYAQNTPLPPPPVETEPSLPIASPPVPPAPLIPEEVPLSIPETPTPRVTNTHPHITAATQVAQGQSASELTSVTLDTHANIVATEDTHGAITTAEYDTEGRPMKIVHPDGTSTYYGYDSNGHLTSIAQGDTQVASILSLAHADDTNATAITYDGDAITALSTKEYTTAYEYDEEGLVSREYRPDGSIVEYDYDELGNVVQTTEIPRETNSSLSALLSLTHAENNTPLYTETATYNDENRLAQFRVSTTEDTIPDTVPSTTLEATTTDSSLITDLISWITTTTHTIAQYIQTTFTYADTATTTPFIDLSFLYDSRGNVTESHNGAFTTTYTYNDLTDTREGTTVTKDGQTLYTNTYTTDSTARIQSHNGISYTYTDTGLLETEGDIINTYDARGNRTQHGDTTYTYEGNRLTKVTSAHGRTTTYTYTPNGAVDTESDSEKGIRTYTYTTEGQIASITTPTDTITYTYNALGQRMTRSDHTGTLSYIYTGGHLKKVTDSTGTILREYFYTPKGELIAVSTQGTLYHIVTDKSHSVTALIDAQTGAVQTQEYDAWGQVTHPFITSLDIGYIGAFSEATLNLSVLGPRVYDPLLGRFLAKDPLPGVITDTLSQNEYIYAQNDPLNQYDPSGHQSILGDTSASPKRALVETNAAITALKEQYTTAATDEEKQSINTALETLMGIKEAQEEAVAEAAVLVPIPNLMVPPIEEVVVPIATTTATSTIEVSTTTPESASSTLPTTTEITPSPEETTTTPPVVPTDTLPQTPETTPTQIDTPAPLVSFLSSYIDHYLLKAEAKSKKSKKAKQKASAKAKAKQQKEAKQLASIAKQLKNLQIQVAIVTQIQIQTLQKKVTTLKDQVAQLKPTPKLNNLDAVTDSQKRELSVTPVQPTISYGSISDYTSLLASGITPPKATQVQGMSESLGKHFNNNTLALGVSLIPGVGEVYDGLTLYTGRDPITEEILTPFTKGLTVIGLATGIGSGKLARDVVTRALDKIATSLGIPIQEIYVVAEEVLKSIDLTKVNRNTLDEFVGKVTEKVETKTIDEIKKNLEKLNFTKVSTIKNGFEPQYIQRGWTIDSIKNTIRNPLATRTSIDRTTTPFSPATVFYDTDKSYVVINNSTLNVLQISDKHSTWIPDPDIINPL